MIKHRPNKKKRVANAPHWTEASTIAQRRKVLDDLRTSREYRNAQHARRHLEDAHNMQGELDRMRAVRGMLAPGLAYRQGALQRGVDYSRQAAAALRELGVR